MKRFSLTHLAAKGGPNDQAKVQHHGGMGYSNQRLQKSLGLTKSPSPSACITTPMGTRYPLQRDLSSNAPRRPATTNHQKDRRQLKRNSLIQSNTYMMEEPMQAAFSDSKVQEEVFFDARTDFTESPDFVTVINDIDDMDFFSLKDQTDSSSSSSQSDVDILAFKLIITPPSPAEEIFEPPQEISDAFYDGENASTLSVSSIYSDTSVLSFAGSESSLNTDLLMPPCPEYGLDRKRHRKARDYREMQQWLTEFLNMQGPRLPLKLRLRVMQIYRIDDSDLAPEIVAQFCDEPQLDDSLAASIKEAEDGNYSNAELLRLLRAFFRSQLPVLHPPKDQEQPLLKLQGFTSDPTIKKQFPEMALSRPLPKSESSPSLRNSKAFQNARARKNSPTTALSRSISSAAFNEPKSKQKPAPPSPYARAATTICAGSGEEQDLSMKKPALPKSAGQQTRANRSRIIAGTFGVVREVLGGKSRTAVPV